MSELLSISPFTGEYNVLEDRIWPRDPELTYEGEMLMSLDRAMYRVAENCGLTIRVDEYSNHPSVEYRYLNMPRGFVITIMVPKYARYVMVRKNRWIRIVYDFIRSHINVDGCFYNIYDIITSSDSALHQLEWERKEIEEERIKDSAARDCARALFKLGTDNLQAAIVTLKERTNTMIPEIKNVIFNDPATIVFWSDGTKTVVKANDEPFDPEKGLAMAIAKKTLGNKGSYYNEFKKWLK